MFHSFLYVYQRVINMLLLQSILKEVVEK
jgi:hypothetical protein